MKWAGPRVVNWAWPVGGKGYRWRRRSQWEQEEMSGGLDLGEGEGGRNVVNGSSFRTITIVHSRCVGTYKNI